MEVGSFGWGEGQSCALFLGLFYFLQLLAQGYVFVLFLLFLGRGQGLDRRGMYGGYSINFGRGEGRRPFLGYASIALVAVMFGCGNFIFLLNNNFPELFSDVDIFLAVVMGNVDLGLLDDGIGVEDDDVGILFGFKNVVDFAELLKD